MRVWWTIYLILAACERMVKGLKQDIGPEHLSLARLKR